MTTPRTNRRAATAATTPATTTPTRASRSATTPPPADQGDSEGFIAKYKGLLIIAILVLLGGLGFAWWSWSEKQAAPAKIVVTPDPIPPVLVEKAVAITDSGKTPASPPREAIGPIETLNGEEPLKFPIIESWHFHRQQAVPVRSVGGQMMGFGNTFTQPPNVGVKPPVGYNRWIRNDRGDWALTK